MATDSTHRRRLSYHNRLFLLLVIFTWVLTGCFIVIECLHDRLAADHNFIRITIGLAILMSVVAWFVTHRLGRNITRLSRFAERQHALARHEEQEKIRIKKQLTNNINHELKTPVAAIQGYLETMVANPDLAPEQRQTFLEKSLAHSDRLRRLLIDVSTLTRMDEGSDVIRKEPVVINDLLDDLKSEMSLRPVGQRMRLNIDFATKVTVMGSPSLLSSIFRNLTDNAIAYSCGRDIFISLEEESADRCTIRFADNGVGVDAEHLPHIFERFYRADKGRSRKAGGTGLGLSIVRNAVAIHGGEISAAKGKEGGLELRFTLRKK